MNEYELQRARERNHQRLHPRPIYALPPGRGTAWLHGWVEAMQQRLMEAEKSRLAHREILAREVMARRELQKMVLKLQRQLDGELPSRRRQFTDETKALWLEVVRDAYSGCSPLGGARLLDDNGVWLRDVVHFDHFFSKARNGPFEGWPVTRAENLSLLRVNRPAYRPRFDEWLLRARDYV